MPHHLMYFETPVRLYFSRSEEVCKDLNFEMTWFQDEIYAVIWYSPKMVESI